MSKKQKPVWVVKHWTGGFYPDTARELRRDAVAAFQAWYSVSDKDWRDDVKYGVHRAVKVTLVETR